MAHEKLFRIAEKFVKKANDEDSLIGNRWTTEDYFSESSPTKAKKSLEEEYEENERMKNCLDNIKAICLEYIQEGKEPRECLKRIYEEVKACKFSR